MKLRLFHFSEEANIPIFYPRPHQTLPNPSVWAISNSYRQNYLFPRNCPRIAYHVTKDTSKSDRERFIGYSDAHYILVIESGWWEILQNTTLYEYEFPIESFQIHNVPAGYYISEYEVTPIACRELLDLPNELLKLDVELRITPTLLPLYRQVTESSLNFSMIRMRNAKGFQL